MLRTLRLLTTAGPSVLREWDSRATFLEIKRALLADWPQGFPSVSNPQVKFIFSGSFVTDDRTIDDLKAVCAPGEPITVHLLITPGPMPVSPARNVPVFNSPEVHAASASPPLGQTPEPLPTLEELQQARNDLASGKLDFMDENVHFHGCCVTEDEVLQMQVVFTRKKRDDNKISLTDVNIFLRTYWKFMQRQGMTDPGLAFPREHFVDCVRKVMGPPRASFSTSTSSPSPPLARSSDVVNSSDSVDKSPLGLTLDQFLEVYFLFDNKAPEETCPHGERDRVCRATQEMHKGISPDSSFQGEIFEKVFVSVDKDHDGKLSCKEVDLLYYLYTAKVILDANC